MKRLLKQKPIVYLLVGWILAIVPHLFEREKFVSYLFMVISFIFIFYAFVVYFRKDF